MIAIARYIPGYRSWNILWHLTALSKCLSTCMSPSGARWTTWWFSHDHCRNARVYRRSLTLVGRESIWWTVCTRPDQFSLSLCNRAFADRGLEKNARTFHRIRDYIILAVTLSTIILYLSSRLSYLILYKYREWCPFFDLVGSNIVNAVYRHICSSSVSIITKIWPDIGKCVD